MIFTIRDDACIQPNVHNQGTISAIRLMNIEEGVTAASTFISLPIVVRDQVTITFRAMITEHALNNRVGIFGGSIMTKSSFVLMSAVLILLYLMK